MNLDTIFNPHVNLALGRVGSAVLAACLAKRHNVTAFVRNPTKLPYELRSHPRLRVFQGDATSQSSLVEALWDQDAIIQAAVLCPASSYSTGDNERVIRTIVAAIKEVQAVGRYGHPPFRLWVLSGQVMLDIPVLKGILQGNIIPIYPEHYRNYSFLQQDAGDVDWNMLCPGKISNGEVRVLLCECR